MLPKKKLCLFLLTFLLILNALAYPVRAAVSSCTATVTPSSVNTNSSTSFSIKIENTSSQTIVWMKITRPSANFTITGFAIGGWNTARTDSDLTITSGSLSTSSNLIVSVTASTGSSEASSADWSVQVSDDSGGASPTSCTGSLGTAISGVGADTTAPTISDIVVSDVTDTAVKITWTTNESSDSVVDYGKTDAYGSTKSDSASVTSHSISIDGLSANTTYNYNLKSKDGAGNTGESGNNTFVTAKAGSTGATQTGTTTTTTVTKTVTITKIVKDDTPPTISLDTDFDKPFTEPPKITGRATDAGDVNPGIGRVEYSVDDGKTWLEVDSIKSPNAKSTTFDFVPAIFEDGNFKIKVRAYDNSGNVTTSTAKSLVIDRLPPQIGGILFSVGPQIIQPTKEGSLMVPKGLDIKITLSSVGGALTIDIFADAQAYSLVKNPDSGLWSGTLNFSKSGEYMLKSKSVDGAQNLTEKELIKVNVMEAGKVLEGASVSVYYFEPGLSQFVLWDGKPFGQDNPQKVDKDGGYRLLLPAGKYYLQISRFGYKTKKTNIFTLEDNLSINNDFILKKSRGFQLGPLFVPFFDFSFEQEDFKLRLPTETAATNKLTGLEMPYFEFQRDNEEINTNDFKGKPTVLTFSSTWSPKTAEQLVILESLPEKQINTVAVMTQEKPSKVHIFEKIGGYKVKLLSDVDGNLLESLGIINLPTHVFLDRKGIIKGIVSGVLTKDELLENLVN